MIIQINNTHIVFWCKNDETKVKKQKQKPEITKNMTMEENKALVVMMMMIVVAMIAIFLMMVVVMMTTIAMTVVYGTRLFPEKKMHKLFM